MRSTEVAVLRWPDQEMRRAALAAVGAPRLLVVDEGGPPPICLDILEDWVRDPVDERELDVRTTVLARRAAPPAVEPELDEDDGILWRGERWTQLSEAQLPVLRLLLECQGHVVSQDEIRALAREGSGSPDPRAVKSLVGRIDKRIRGIGLEIHRVRGRGWMLIDAEARPVRTVPRPGSRSVHSRVTNRKHGQRQRQRHEFLVSANGPSRTDR